MNADVEEAIKALQKRAPDAAVQTLIQSLREQDAEIARLRESTHYADGVASLAMKHRDTAEQRAEKADALLRECAFHFVEAAESIQDWGAYAMEYFQEKHDLPGTVAEVKAYADRINTYLGAAHD